MTKSKEEGSRTHLWTLPAGTLQEHEHLEAAALRIYSEAYGLENVFLEQLRTFVYPSNHTHPRAVHILYYAMIHRHNLPVDSEDDGKKWLPVSIIPTMSETVRKYLQIALQELQEKVRSQPIGFHQLPAEFEFTQLQHVYEMILERKLDRDVFRSKLYEADLLVPLTERGTYRFNAKRYLELKNKGFCLNI